MHPCGKPSSLGDDLWPQGLKRISHWSQLSKEGSHTEYDIGLCCGFGQFVTIVKIALHCFDMGIELFQLSSCRVLTNKSRDRKLRMRFRKGMEEVSANIASGAGSVKVVSPD